MQFLIRSFGKLHFQSGVLRNAATLVAGTVISQAIPIVISPILTRMYGPDDFGALAFFVAVTSIFGTICCGRYELAIMLPKSDSEAITIATLSIVLSASASVILLLVIIAFSDLISILSGHGEIGFWLYFIPLAVFFTGFFNTLCQFNNRMQNYSEISKAIISKGIISAVIQVAGGLLHAGPSGLLASPIISSLFANSRLLRSTFTSLNYLDCLDWARVKKLAYRYRDFPKFSVPAALANTLSQNGSNMIVGICFSVSALGHLSLVQRILGLPASAIGNAIGQLYFQRASSERINTGSATHTFVTTVLITTLISVPPLVVFSFYADIIFRIVFGQEWESTGDYARLLAPLYAIRFITSAVSTTTSIFERQRLAMYWQLLLMTLLVSTVLFSYYFSADFIVFVLVYSVIGTLCYFFLLMILFRISRGCKK